MITMRLVFLAIVSTIVNSDGFVLPKESEPNRFPADLLDALASADHVREIRDEIFVSAKDFDSKLDSFPGDEGIELTRVERSPNNNTRSSNNSGGSNQSNKGSSQGSNKNNGGSNGSGKDSSGSSSSSNQGTKSDKNDSKSQNKNTKGNSGDSKQPSKTESSKPDDKNDKGIIGSKIHDFLMIPRRIKEGIHRIFLLFVGGHDDEAEADDDEDEDDDEIDLFKLPGIIGHLSDVFSILK